jgi:hypothetical protein
MSSAARKHLRSDLPPSPIMPTPPPPPFKPAPWTWQCCSCRTVYGLAVTRRCLVCSHHICTVINPPTTRRHKRRVDKRGQPITCCTEFDYGNWQKWGLWRRSINGAHISESQRDSKFLKRLHDDWMDCDYPSQCHQRRNNLRQEIGFGILDNSDLDSDPDDDETGPGELVPLALCPDDEPEMNEAIELLKGEKKWLSMLDGKRRSPAADGSTLNDELYSLLGEDDEPIPLDYDSNPTTG